jgi:hypothetical protein
MLSHFLRAASKYLLYYFDFKTATNASSSATISSVNFGPPSDTREVFVLFFWSSTATRTLSSATIGGVSASISSQYSATQAGVACLYATVPTGSTGTISVTMNGVITSYSLSSYSVYNRPNRGSGHTAVVESASPNANGGFTTSSLTTPANGFSLGFFSVSGTNQSITINNDFITDVNELNAGGGVSFGASRNCIATASQATTITVSWTGTRSVRYAFWSFN